MNKPLPIILLLAVLGLCGGFAYQHHQAVSLRREVAQLQSELATAREQSAREAAESQRAKDKVASYKAANEQLETRNKELAAGGAPAAAVANAGEKKEGGGFAGMMKKMFTDPEMKKAMRSQQAMGIQMMYGDFAKELGLAPDDARQVMDLLADRQMAMSAEGMKMWGGEASDGATAEESQKKIAEGQKEFDAQIEAVLGKDGMAKMKEYEKTIGDRMQIQQFKNAFSATGTPLEEPQATGLLAIMKEERLKEPPSPFDASSKDPGAAMKAMQDPAMMEKLLASQRELGQRVYDRARTVLSPDQMTQFAQIQKQQLEMQEMGLKMGLEMMKGGQDKAPPPPKQVGK